MEFIGDIKKSLNEMGEEHGYWLLSLTLVMCFMLTIGWVALNLDFVNKNQAAISVILTVVIALSTFLYALLTSRLLLETISMRRIQTEPKLSIRIVPRDEWLNWIDLKIENIGGGTAYNVKFDVTPDIECFPNEPISKILRPINYLAPKEERSTFLTSLTEDYETKKNTPFKINVMYTNKSGRFYSELFTIDFSEFEGIKQLGEPPLYKIAKSIEAIDKNIAAIVSGSKKLEVSMHTQKEIELEKQKLDRRMNEFQEKAKKHLAEEQKKLKEKES